MEHSGTLFARVYNQPPAPYRHRHLHLFHLFSTKQGCEHLCAQYCPDSLPFPPTPTLIREMSNAPQTTPYASVSIYGDPKGLPSARERKKPPPPSVLSWLLSLPRRHPFLLSFAISVIITGTIAAIVRLSNTQGKHNPYSRIPYNASGVSAIAGPSWSLTDSDVSQIVLIGHSANLDQPIERLSLDWEILGCGAYRLPTYPPVTGALEAAGCDALDRVVDFYFSKWVYIRCRCPQSTR